MLIYRISSDHAFKNLSGKTDKVVGKFHEYAGQPIGHVWEPPVFCRLEDVEAKKTVLATEKKLIADFDARCHGNIFLLRRGCMQHLSFLSAEFLPVTIEGIPEPFVFMNLLVVVDAIDFTGLDFSASMAMLRGKSIKFLAANIGRHTIFRDRKVPHNYYCNDEFIRTIERAGISGLQFTIVGTADV